MAQDLITAPLLAFTLAAAGIGLLRRAAALLPRAVPNARSLHARPIPRAAAARYPRRRA